MSLLYQKKLLEGGHVLGVVSDLDVIFYKGPEGRMRVSRRVLDEKVSKLGFPILDFTINYPVIEGEVVAITPAMYPIGMSFVKEEKLRIRVGGKDLTAFPPADGLGAPAPNVVDISQGVEVYVHGGLVDGTGSFIVLPLLNV